MTSNLASQKLACILILTGFFLVVVVVIFLWNGFLMTHGSHDNDTTTILLASNIELSSHNVRNAPELQVYEVRPDVNGKSWHLSVILNLYLNQTNNNNWVVIGLLIKVHWFVKCPKC